MSSSNRRVMSPSQEQYIPGLKCPVCKKENLSAALFHRLNFPVQYVTATDPPRVEPLIPWLGETYIKVYCAEDYCPWEFKIELNEGGFKDC